MSAARPPPRSSASVFFRIGFQLLRTHADGAVRKVLASRVGRVHWKRGLVRLVVCNAVFVGLLAAAGFYYFYFDRNDLPDLDGFTRFEFTTIGHIYDANGQPLKEMASEARQITRYEEIPPICPRRHRRRRRQELLLPFRNSGTMKSASFQRDQVARTIVQIMACAGATD